MVNMAGNIVGGIPYETLSFVLAPGEARPVGKTTNYLALMSATFAADALISFNGASFFNLPPGIALSDFQSDSLWVKNSNGAPNTVVIATGLATFRDNRIVFDVTSPLPVTLSAAVTVIGTAVHSAPATSAPVRVAGTVKTAIDTTLAANDVSDLFISDSGQLINKPYALPQADWSYAPPAGGISNSAVGVTAKAAQAAGVRNYVTAVQLSWDALTTATEFVIRDGAAGTVLWRFKVPAGIAGSYGRSFPTPLMGTAATLVEIQTITASVAGGVLANVQGYGAK